MNAVRVYWRIVTKNELRQIKMTNQLLSQEPRELVLAFDATNILGGLELSRDRIRLLGKLSGD